MIKLHATLLAKDIRNHKTEPKIKQEALGASCFESFLFLFGLGFLDFASLIAVCEDQPSAKSSHNYEASFRSMQVLLNKKVVHLYTISTPYPQYLAISRSMDDMSCIKQSEQHETTH